MPDSYSNNQNYDNLNIDSKIINSNQAKIIMILLKPFKILVITS